MILKFKLFDGGIVPTKGTAYAACFDLALPADVMLEPFERKKVSLQIGFEPEFHNYYILMYPRSSLLAKFGLIAPTSVIDWDYRGPVHAIMANITDKPVYLKQGDHVMQIALIEQIHTQLVCTDTLSKTVRGEKGIGSTRS